jgi:hypothetical protein
VFLNGVYGKQLPEVKCYLHNGNTCRKHTGIARHCYPGSGVLQVYDKLNTYTAPRTAREVFQIAGSLASGKKSLFRSVKSIIYCPHVPRLQVAVFYELYGASHICKVSLL